MAPFSLRRAIVGAALAGTFLGATRAAEKPAVAPGPIVELPKFEVTDSRLLPPPENWLYAEIPGFEILSRISERETKRFVRDFMLLQEVVRAIMPNLVAGYTPVPTALILCGGRGKGFDEFLPQERNDERYGTNMLTFINTERAAIVVDFALAELQVEADTRLEADPYRSFYAGYFRFLLRRQLGDKAPPWFEEGLVQLFAATEFDRKVITFAQLGDGFGAEKVGDFNHMLAQRSIMPFGQMLAANGPRQRSPFWSAQCYAFVHMCLYGWDKKYQKPFLTFVKRLETEEPSEKLFKECFKKSYNDVATELRGYVSFTAYRKMEFKAKKGQEIPEPPAVALKAAADADVGRIKGEVLRLGGHGEAARNTLIAPYVRGERDPRLLAALGLDEKQGGRDERARKFLEAASNAKVERPRAYLELARLRFKDAEAAPAGGEGKFSQQQVSEVLTPLFVARQQRPPMADVYTLIAETWSRSVVAPEAKHLEPVFEGVKLFPRDATLLMQVALLAAKRGFTAEAVAVAKLGSRSMADAAERDRFTLMVAALERDAGGKTTPTEDTPTTETTKPYILK